MLPIPGITFRNRSLCHFKACCHQSVAGNIQSQYWEKQPMPPSRSESIQRWLLGRPPVGESL